jgi:hypothetical protein
VTAIQQVGRQSPYEAVAPDGAHVTIVAEFLSHFFSRGQPIEETAIANFDSAERWTADNRSNRSIAIRGQHLAHPG